MFTGLVQAVGTVAAVEPTARGVRLAVDFGGWGHRPGVGDSISVSGCCLTAAAVDGARVSFDVIPETLSKTTLGGLKVGERVNLEHACRADALMGGHIVQGHVDGVGEVVKVEANPEDWRVVVRPPSDGGFMEWVSPKGSVTIEGVSLTVAELSVARGEFGVALIPVTLEKTTLGLLRAGSKVNLEGDVIAKTVVHWMRHYSGR